MNLQVSNMGGARTPADPTTFARRKGTANIEGPSLQTQLRRTRSSRGTWAAPETAGRDVGSQTIRSNTNKPLGNADAENPWPAAERPFPATLLIIRN